MSAALEVEGLSVAVASRGSWEDVVESVDIRVAHGECLCIVGESGSGKTLTAQAVTGTLPRAARVTGGRIVADGRVGWMPQNPMAAFNPTRRVGPQVTEVLRVRRGVSRTAAAAAGLELLRRAGLPAPETIWRARPYELSGGQCQRALLAMALADDPTVVVADEPTTALDVTTQVEVLRLLCGLRDAGTAIVLVTHDLGVAAAVGDRVAVFQGGRIVEQGPMDAFLAAPAHEHSRALLSAAAKLGRSADG